MWISIKSHLVRLSEKFVPKSQVKTRNNPKWFNTDIKKSIREKKRAWTKFKETKTQRDEQRYKQIEKMTKNKIRNAKKKLEQEVIGEAKTNPKRFYAYINGARKTR